MTKKITLFITMLLFFAFSWQVEAQFTESFDTEIPATWTVLNEDGGNTWEHNTDNPYSGAGQVRIRWNSQAHDDYLISPSFTVTAGVSDQVTFYAGMSGTTYTETFSVKLSTTAGVTAADFTVNLGDEIATDAVPNHGEYSYDLTAYVGQTIAIAIQATDTDRYYLYVDEFTVGTPPSCLAPTDLAITNITTEGVDISFTDNASASAWEYVMQADGTGEPADGVAGTAITAITESVTGLDVNTAYEVYVRTDCTGGDFSTWRGPVSFTTLCVAETSFPYIEEFEGDVEPMCWSEDRGGSNYGWNSDDDAYEGNASARFNSYFNSNGNTSSMYTTTFDLSSLDCPQLSFYYKNPTGGDFTVSISSDGGTSYTVLEAGLTGQTSYIQKMYDISAYTTDSVIIEFKGTSNYGNGDAYIYLDNVEIKSVTAPAPTGDAAQSFVEGATYADIVVANTDDYTDVYWYAANSTDGTLIVITDELTAGTYYAFQAEDCAVGLEVVIEVTELVSIDDLAKVGFNYYPNPVENNLTMTANENITFVSIFNMLGQEVYNEKLSTLEANIDMSRLSNGTYFVKAQVGNTVGAFKIVKE
ncbi:MAG TPA: T9SS type A sorting domain-containing protein [Lutibacter sp.]|nr:T9SS type A sorting domain-containing protein [Lutibacter sp.]